MSKYLTQRELDTREGHEVIFFKNVDKRSDTEWIWTGYTNNNHNDKKSDPNSKTYEYPEFSLCSYEDRFLSKPKLIHKSRMGHRIILFLTFGEPVPEDYEVFPLGDGNHLNISPKNLGVRHKKSGQEWTADEFYLGELRKAA